MRSIVFVGLLSLAGCVKPMLWDKPGATQAEFNADNYSCQKDVRQSGYFGEGLEAAINMREFMKQCMVAHGYALEQ